MKLYRIVILYSLLVLSDPAFSQDVKPEDSSEVNRDVFEKVEKEASFPGGDQGWRQYLMKNLNASVPVDNNAPIGNYTVIVQFIVDRGGNITDIKALTRLGYGMEQEVIRIIKNSGQWEPATQNKIPVKAYRKQPVTFVVEQDGLDIFSKIPYVLFAGTNNELTVEADKIKNENLKVTITKGTITPTSDGKFIARVAVPGERVIVRVFNSKKNDREIGAVSFEVRPLNEMPPKN